jgi:hypothetical protein
MMEPDSAFEIHSSSSNRIPSSDLETERKLQQQQENAAQEFLHVLGSILEQADGALDDMEQHQDKLGHAMVRKCQELADGVGQLASQLEQHTDEDRQRIAQACLEDVDDLRLQLQQEQQDGNGGSRTESSSFSLMAVQQHEHNDEQLANLKQEDFVDALAAATSLLRDVEGAFRDIGEKEAEDIADAALTLARLFLASLQSLHATMDPSELVAAASAATNTNRSIEGDGSNGITHIELLDDNGEPVVPSSQERQQQRSSTTKHKEKRIRVLWPPLGPAVANACEWGQSTAQQQPLLAVALGLTLWPVAIVTTVVGGSLVVCDHYLQDVYRHFQEGPLLVQMERGASQMVQASKLTLLCTKLVAKQTLRIVSRQVERHGGVGEIAGQIGNLAVDRALHPIDTVGMAWNGLSAGFGMVQKTVQQVFEQEQRDTAIGLQ